MDYFSFDLQLFAEDPVAVAVDLKNAADFLATTELDSTKTLFVFEDGTTSETNTESKAVASITLTVADSTITKREITVKAAAADTVTISGATQAALAGYSIATKAALDGSATAAATTVNFSADNSDSENPVAAASVTVKGTAATDFVVSSAGITTEKIAAITCNNGVVLSNTTATKITVDVAGTTISDLTAQGKFSVKDSSNDGVATAYEVGGDSGGSSSLTVTGDQIGLYSAVKREGATITLVADGADTVKDLSGEQGAEQTLAPTLHGAEDSFDLVAQTTATTSYYAIKYQESKYTLASGATEDISTPAEGVLGYAKVVTDSNMGNPTATVSFVATDGTTALALLGNVNLNAENLTQLSVGNTKFAAMNVTAGATGIVTLSNVVQSANISVNGNDYTKSTTDEENKIAVSYVASYDELKGDTIALKDLTDTTTTDDNATNWYFTVKDDGETNHGKHTYSLTQVTGDAAHTAPTTPGGVAYFTVAVKTTTSEEVTTTSYEISSTGTKDSEGVDIGIATNDIWENLKIDGSELAPSDKQKYTVKVTPSTAESAKDKYAVTAPVGVVVMEGDIAAGNDYVDVTANRNKGTVVTTLTETNPVTLLKENGEAVKYGVSVKDAANDGNQTITIKTFSNETSYFTVTWTAATENANAKCTVKYEGAIPLTGLKKDTEGAAQQITLTVPEGYTNAIDLDISGAAAAFIINNLPAGTTVIKAEGDTDDTINYKTGAVYNNVSIDLAAVTKDLEDGTSVYYEVVADTDSEVATAQKQAGYTTVAKLGSTITAAEGKNYFTITKNEKDYVVTYHKATGEGVTVIDLGAATGGKTTVNAADITDVATTIHLVEKDGEDNTLVNAYAVTNVVAGGYTGGGIYTGATGTTAFEGKVEYLSADVFTPQATGSEIKLNNTTNICYVVSAEKGDTGITTYSIGTGKASFGENESGFKVVFDETSKKVEIQYVENGTGVTEEAFLSVLDAKDGTIKIDATGIDTTKYTTIVLTKDDAEAGTGFAYTVSKIPKAVSVENATDEKDTLEYVPSYELDSSANTLAVSGKAATLYYDVTYTGGGSDVKGVYTCKIGAAYTAETPPAARNHFVVTTSGNDVTVKYVQATGESAATAMDLDGLTVNVTLDASVPSNATVTFGAASDDSITFDVTGIAKEQNVALKDSSTATVKYAFTETDAVDYPNTDTAIALGSADNDSVTYYVVEKSGGATTGTLTSGGTKTTSGVTGRGVTTYALALTDNGGKDVPATGSSYIAVTHGKYITTISYVDGAGIDLSAIGEQIVIDASSIPETVDTIDLTNTGSKVKYNVTGLKSTEIDVTHKGESDTVSFDAVAVAITGDITLGTETTVNYLVASDGSLTKMEKAPTASSNYITVKKSGDAYTVTYTQATEDAVYTVGSESKITVDAASAGKATITNSVPSLAAEVKNAVAGATVSGTDTTISYTTGFKWAAGVYYMALPDASPESGNVDLDASATAGATAAGKSYLLVKVTKTAGKADGDLATYTVTAADYINTAESNGNLKGDPSAITSGTSYNGKISAVAPSEAAIIDVTDIKGTLTGVLPGSEITGTVDSDLTITTADFDATEGAVKTLKIGKTTYTSGGTDPLSVKDGKAVSGAFVLSGTKGTSLTGSSATENKVAFANEDGGEVVVTFADGAVKSLTGLDSGEQVTVTVTAGSKGVTYALDGNYIHRYNEDTGKSSYAAATAATGGDVLSIAEASWASSKGQEVGQAVDLDGESMTAYIAIGKEKTADVTVKDAEATPGTAQLDTYYVKAVTDSNKQLSLSIVKGNALNLVDPATDYTGTITIDATGANTASGIKFSGDTTAAYTVKVTNAASGSEFTDMNDKDSVTTAKLNATNTVKMDDLTYKLAEAGTMKFTGGGLTDGVLTVTGKTTEDAAATVAVLPNDVTVTYNDHDAGATAGMAIVTVAGGAVSSIKDLGKGEEIILTTDTTITSYKTDTSAGTTVTKTVTNRATGAVTTATATLTGEGDEVIKDVTYTTSNFSFNRNFKYSQSSEGYFKVSNTVEVKADGSATSDTMERGDYFVKATAVYDSEAGISTLTLTPKVVDASGAFVDGEAASDLANQSVTVTLDGATKVNYTNDTNLKAQITKAVDGSTFTMKNGETVTTIASFAENATITVNDITYTAGGSTQIVVNATNDSAEVVSGVLKLTSGSIDGALEDVAITGADSTGAGIVVTYGTGTNAGKITALTHLNEGEMATITNAKGETTTYYAKSDTLIWKTASDGKVTVATISADGDVLGNSVVWNPTVELKEAFSTKVADGATEPDVGYFLVNGTTKAATIEDVDKDTVIATYKDVGTVVVKASLAINGTLTLTKESITNTGAVSETSPAAGFTQNEVEALTLNVTGGQAIQYTKQTGIEKITVNGAGSGSKFTSFVDGDTVTTASLTKGTGKVTFGSTDYVAGADGTMTFDGENIVDATILATGTGSTVVVDADKVTTTTIWKYTAGTDNDGVALAFADGLATSVTGLGAGESIQIVKTVKAKDGTETETDTTYSATKSGSVYVVTRTVVEDGITTVSKQNFANLNQNVMKDTGWTVDSQTLKTGFDFGDLAGDNTATGYFTATLNELTGEYEATVAKQDTAADVTLNDYYVEVTASMAATGVRTIESIRLVHVSDKGVVTEATTKTLGTVSMTLPEGYIVELPETHEALTINATKGTLTNVLATDVVKGALAAAGDVISINGTSYVAAETVATTGVVYEIADNKVTEGNFLVKGTALTATGGEVVSVNADSADGVKVVFANGEISTIKDLDSGETVTIKNGNDTTTYSYDGTSGSEKTTKTVVSGGVTETWTKSGALTDSANVISLDYSTKSNFDWPTTENPTTYGYFDVTSAAATITKQTDVTITPAVSLVFARVQVTGSATAGYTITSVKLLSGTSLEDATGTTGDPANTLTIANPTGNIKLDSKAVDISGNTSWTARNFQFAITGAAKGQVFSGLSAVDTITTGKLYKGESVTVNGIEYTASLNNSTMTLNGDGTAQSGTFTLTSDNKILVTDATSGADGIAGNVTIVAGETTEAKVQVTNNDVASVSMLTDGEEVTITAVKNGVTTVTELSAGQASTGGEIPVTKTVTVNGVATTYIGTAENEGVNLLSDSDVKYVVSGAKVTSYLNWTKAESTGYIKLTVDDAKKAISEAVKVAAETKEQTLKVASGEIYLKVSTKTADGVTTITAIQPQQVQADGTLKDITTIESGTINLTAPTNTALVLNRSSLSVPATVAVNITGAAANSAITMQQLDTLETAPLKPDDKVTIGSTVYTAATAAALKFAGNALSSGAVKMNATGQIKASGADGAVNTDDVTIDYTKTTATEAETVVVTVANGVVTNVSGFANSGNKIKTTVTGGVEITYTYNGTLLNAAVAGTTAKQTFTTIALAQGAEISDLGTLGNSGTLVSSASNNPITIVHNGTSFAVQSGMLALNGTIIANADGTKVVGSTGDVTIVDGKLTSLSGATSATVTEYSSVTTTGETPVTTYTATVTSYAVSGTKVTKTVKVGTSTDSAAKAEQAAASAEATTYTGFLASGGDVLSASYTGTAEETVTEEAMGQFSWQGINGRSTGYFTLNSKYSTTVKEQTVDQAATTKNGATTNYLVANLSDADLNNVKTLSFAALEVKSTLANSSTKTYTVTKKALDITGTDFAGGTITITAPTDQKISYEKGTGTSAAAFGVVINNLAKGSTIANLDTGDKVTTNTLAADESVTMDTVEYTAGAKGKLVFVGEGEGSTTTAQTALLSGTIKLADGKAYRLAGATETNDKGNTTNDITVQYDKSGTATDVIVKATNGVVTSITGLTNKDDTVTITNASGKIRNGSETIELKTGNIIVYKVLANQMIQRTIYNEDNNTPTKDGVIDTNDTPTATGYVTLAKAGAEIYSATYKATETTAVSSLSFDDETASTTTGYVLLGDATDVSTPKSIGSVTSGASTAGNLITKASAGADTFAAMPGQYYLRVVASTTKASTTKAGTTTIKSLDVMKAAANGALATVKATEATYGGTLTIDGTKTVTTDTEAQPPTTTTEYAVLNYSVPKSRKWNLTVTNAAIGSTFANLATGDQVTTADTTGYALKGTVTLYKAEKNTTTEEKVTTTEKVTTSGNGVTIDTTGGVVSAIKNFTTNKETVTLVTDTTDGGLVTTIYKATVDKNGNLTVTRTQTAADGAKTVYTGTVAKADVSDGASVFWDGSTSNSYITYAADTSQNTVSSKFDWTMNNSSTGYFLAKSGKATVVGNSVNITKNQASNKYIAVTISANGVVSGIKQQYFDTDSMAMADVTEAADIFEGTITVKAPTAYALTLDRGSLGVGIATDTNTDGTYKTALAITGAITDSTLSSLVNGDTVTTGRLAKDKGTVTVNGSTFTAGAASKLGFAIQADTTTLTAGTIALANGATQANTEGTDLVYIYNGSETVAVQAGENTGITVLAKTDNKGVTTFTVGDLGENETFTVGEVTYQKSGTTLLRVYTTTDADSGKSTEVREVYAISSGKTISSTILDTSYTKNWKAVEATFTEQTSGEQKSNFGAIATKLSLADSYIAAAKKANANYLTLAQTVGGITNAFVVDSYLAKGTSTRGLAASVVTNTAAWQTAVGDIKISADANGVYTYTYAATKAIAQAITVTKGWTVTASDHGDTITGASSGTNTITLGAGDDSVKAGGANETFNFNFDFGSNGRDTLSGYAQVKDTININGDFAIQLDTVKGGNVFLFRDDSGDGVYDKEEEGVALMAVAGKAVKIGTSTYYFGNGTRATGATKTTSGTTFSYVENAYYVGNDSGKNTLKVTTDKTKATKTTLGDAVTVSLADTDHYTNITTLDGASSANKMVLVSGDSVGTSYALKGGSYQSTLAGGVGNDMITGGTGEDVFWFESGLSGSDTIKSYTAAKDAVYLGKLDDGEDLSNKSVEISAESKSVVLTQGKNTVTVENAVSTTKALRISTDGTTANTLSYYVGAKGTSARKATNAFTATVGTDATQNADTKEISLTSYYVGNDYANDTLKIANTTANKKKAVTASVSLAEIAKKNAASIDTLDVSGLASAANSKVTVQGAAGGTFTLIGSKSTNVKETFDLSNFLTTTGTNEAKITNLTVGDVVELGESIKLTQTSTRGNLTYSVKSADGITDYGTLVLNGVTNASSVTVVQGDSVNHVKASITRK